MRPICLAALIGWWMFAAKQAGAESQPLDKSFQQQVKPFLTQYCERCHHAEKLTSGIRVDHLDASLEDRHLKLWEGLRKEILSGAMPPEGEKQPTKEQRQQAVEWIGQALNLARSRPDPKNGGVRRLTVAQYRNTLRELLLLDENLTDILPPDAVSRDGFLNNQSTLQLSPLLLEAYFEIAGKALSRSIVDPTSKPTIQNFRVELGASVNPKPFPENLILGADSLLLKNSDFVVNELKAAKPFDFVPFAMKTKYRFIEGYQGNDTVRGWRDYDSIYHAVYACMRGAHGYPKGQAYGTVPQGLLLRPAIPSAEIFGVDSTYGPKANFKIALRELPDHGRFRVTVTAAKYDDGLLLDSGAIARATDNPKAVVSKAAVPAVQIPEAGIYQVDIHAPESDETPVRPDSSRLDKELIGYWSLDGNTASKPESKELAGRLVGDAKFVKSPFGQAVSLDGNGDSVMIPRTTSMDVKTGDFSVSAWIHPKELRQAGIVSLGKYGWTTGWYLDMPNAQGVLRIETAGPDNQSNGTVSSPPGAIGSNAWHHVAAVVRRGSAETLLYVNGHLVAKGKIGGANLDNPKVGLHIGRIQDAQQFRGEIDEVRIHRRALEPSEIQAMVEPGIKLVQKPSAKAQEITLKLGAREFTGTLNQPAFLLVRLRTGELPVRVLTGGSDRPAKLVFTRLAETEGLSRQFEAFEKRAPQLGVHMGFRRDCGSTLAPVGSPQPITGTKLTQYVFEGSIRNFPSPDVEKDNVNYLAGVREIGIRSEHTNGADMPRLLIKSVEFEGPHFETWPPKSHSNIFVDFDRKDDKLAYARRIIREFASRAYRRPVTAREEAALMTVFEKARDSEASFQASIKDALQVALTSPQFLFLVENSPTPAAEPLDQDELASKLSYFLWIGPPDAVTLKLAGSGELRKNLNAETDRLIADDRFARFANEFTAQWLALDKFQVLEPDRRQFPKLTRDTRAQLLREPVEYMRHLIRNNLPARYLIESDFVLANEVTAGYYDLTEKPDRGFQFVPVRHGRPELGGVLSQAAILAGLSDGRESNPIKRGAWLARRIVAEPPDDPPPNVPALKEEKKNLTLRERLESHRNQKGCFQCHSKIDPWGVPFEEFDAGGRLKLAKTDSRSTLPDKTTVNDFSGLKTYLAQDRIDQVAFSMLKHFAIYACGRSLTYNELEYLRKNNPALKADGYRLRDMIKFVVNSPIFLEK